MTCRVMASVLWLGLAGWGGVACTGGGGPSGQDTDVTPANAVQVGPFGAERTLIEVDIGNRTRGFSSRVNVLRAEPRDIRDGSEAVWAIFLPEREQSWDQYRNTAAHLASWGFVVLVPQFDSISGLRTDVEILQDLQALWEAVLQGKIETRLGVRSDTLALAGHGRGGRIALAGATAIRDVGAVVAISPVDGEAGAEDQIRVSPTLAAQLDVPVGLFGAGRGSDSTGRGEPCVPEGRDERRIWGDLRASGFRVELPDGGHGDIVEDCLQGLSDAICTRCVAGRDAVVTVNAARATMAAVLGASLRGDASLSAFWNTNLLSDYAEGVRIDSRRSGDPPSRDPGDTAGRLDTADLE